MKNMAGHKSYSHDYLKGKKHKVKFLGMEFKV